jgi:MerR family transcriptional regulator, redox-sensitive transcriptional activator SoxR
VAGQGGGEGESEPLPGPGDDGGSLGHTRTLRLEPNFKSRATMDTKDLLTIGEVARRSGFPQSALRYYEREGLVSSTRTTGGQRRYERSVLRRLAFIRAARTVGVGLDEVRAGLDQLPAGRTPNRADWTRLSRSWRGRLDEQIDALVALRDGLDSCIGCGCLSLQRCQLYTSGDRMAAAGPGARLLPPMLRRTPAEGV